MITSSDREYKTTKRIKQGKKKLKAPFDELAQWISSTWKVNVLNVIYDKATSVHKPRLQVIVEHQRELLKFQKGHYGNFIAKKQNAIAEKFMEILARDGTTGFDVDGLFVVFSAFAPLAEEEADGQISEEEIEALKSRIGNPDLWEISRCFGHVTFFFFTYAQVKHYEAEGMKAVYAKLYFDLLKSHDELGYLKEKEFKVDFDSKQNLDENYESNWFYYYR
jgi:hypothetical protein